MALVDNFTQFYESDLMIVSLVCKQIKVAQFIEFVFHGG